MKIALVVEGTRGDVHPMLELGSALEQRGHDVILCAPPDFDADAAARDIEFRGIGLPIQQEIQARAKSLLAGSWSAIREGKRYAEHSIQAQFRGLPPATADADLIIGAGLAFAAATAAELHGVPYRYVVYCPALFPSGDHAPFVIPYHRGPAWLNRLLWRVFLPFQHHVLAHFVVRERNALGLPPVTDLFRHFLSEAPLLAADAGLASLPPDLAFPVTQVPYLQGTPPNEAGLPAKLESFLEQGEPPIYIGFGSMPAADAAATTALVLRAVEPLGCRTLISKGWANLGAGPLPANVLAIGNVDHRLLFPRLAAVVHHGGAGTTTTVARAGVPQVVVPHVLDQFYWAERVRRLGLGAPAPWRHRLTSESLASTLGAVLGNEFVAERAHELGQRLREEISLDPILNELV